MLSLFLWISVASIGIQLLGLALFVRFTSRPKPRLAPRATYPGVTILKPVFSTEDSERENWDRFFHQDYPGAIQLLFVASHENDPAVPLVREFLAKYPQFDAKLVLSHTRRAYWKKIDAVYDGHQEAKHDFLIISDSDVQVGSDYVSQMVAELEQPGVSLVSTPQWDYGANNFGSALKTLANNADSATVVMIADTFARPKRLALGHSIGFRLSEFHQLRPDRWDVISRFLAEDLCYGYLFSEKGKLAVLRNVYCPVNFQDKSVSQVVSQKVRWLINQKMEAGNRWIYSLGVWLYPEIPALVYALCGGGWMLFAVACAVRIVASAAVELLYLGSLRMTPQWFWTVPLWDLSQVYFFIHGFFKTRIAYHGKTYRVVNRHFLTLADK